MSSPFYFEKRTLWFGKIKLYENEIVISGWNWSGPTEEHVSIGNIRCVEKWTVQKGPNFRIMRENDRSLYGRVETGAKFWADAFREDDRVELKLRH